MQGCQLEGDVEWRNMGMSMRRAMFSNISRSCGKLYSY